MNTKKGGGNCSQLPTAFHLADVLQMPVKTKKTFQLLSDFYVSTRATDNSKPFQRTNKHIPMDLRGATEAKSRHFPLCLDSNVLLF